MPPALTVVDKQGMIASLGSDAPPAVTATLGARPVQLHVPGPRHQDWFAVPTARSTFSAAQARQLALELQEPPLDEMVVALVVAMAAIADVAAAPAIVESAVVVQMAAVRIAAVRSVFATVVAAASSAAWATVPAVAPPNSAGAIECGAQAAVPFERPLAAADVAAADVEDIGDIGVAVAVAVAAVPVQPTER